MLGDIIVKKESERNKLNNLDPYINRGFELMLSHHSRGEKPSKPKNFSFHFGKMLSLFSREINFEFSLDIRKK
jgi:hypothetical protein